MTKYKSVLCNAEAFGFGPASAIAVIARELARRGVRIGYIGGGHTLDLQRDVGYDEVYDIQDLKLAARKYDVFLTAMDFETAAVVSGLGTPVIIYDALAWYWPRIPDIARCAELYLAQDFFGVAARLAGEQLGPCRAVVVPSIVQPMSRNRFPKSVLVNLGGLMNPLWDNKLAVLYARAIVAAVKAVLSHENLVFATSGSIAAALSDPAVRTYTPDEMQKLFADAKYALMTPGLGNVYDAAAFGLPVVWLPPANDSQGLQLELLHEHGCADAAIRWTDLGLPVDYAQPQQSVIDSIGCHIAALANDAGQCETLQSCIRKSIPKVQGLQTGRASKLLETFGSGGAIRIHDEILQVIKEESYASA